MQMLSLLNFSQLCTATCMAPLSSKYVGFDTLANWLLRFMLQASIQPQLPLAYFMKLFLHWKIKSWEYKCLFEPDSRGRTSIKYNAKIKRENVL